jgi:hypothetical protein
MTQPEVTEYRIIHAVTDATGQRNLNVRLWISGVSRATGSALTAATSFLRVPPGAGSERARVM